MSAIELVGVAIAAVLPTLGVLWVTLLARKLPSTPSASEQIDTRSLETSAFEAYTHCGGCGKLDLHAMREPRHRSDQEIWEAIVKAHRDADTFQTLEAWSGQSVQSIKRRMMPFHVLDEKLYDVIRICECGNEWGQR